MTIHWTATAIADVKAIRAYITEDNPEAANRVARIIRQSVEQLAVFASSGRVGRVAETREFVIPRLPYIAVYTVSENKISVASVLHGRRSCPVSF